MTPLAFVFGGAGQQIWVPRRNSVIVGATINNGIAIVSTNPARAIADVTTAAANALLRDVLLYLALTAVRVPIEVPANAGQNYYITASAQLVVLLFVR